MSESSIAASCGMHATPVISARQRLPVAYLLHREPRRSLVCSGTDKPFTHIYRSKYQLRPRGHLHYRGPYLRY